MKLDLGLPSWNVAQIDDITLGQAYTTKVEKLDEAMDPHYRAGMTAAYDGKKASANPHDKFSMEHKLWKQGHKDNYRPVPKDAKSVKEENEIEEQKQKYTSKNDTQDELNSRPGAWRGDVSMSNRTKKDGSPSKEERYQQYNLKQRILMKKKTGGLTGPKGALPEETEMNEELYKFKEPIKLRGKRGEDVTVHGYESYRDVFKGSPYGKKMAGNNQDVWPDMHVHPDDHHKLPKSLKDIYRLAGKDMKEETESLQEAKPKTIPMGAARHPAAAPGHPNHAQWLAAQPKRPSKAPKSPSVRYGKPIDTSDPKLHKALEDHFGGTFQHFDTDPKHGHTAEGHPVMHARVRHSYTADDFGVPDDEMQDTDEAHSARVIRKGGKYHVMFQGEKMHESAIMKMVLDKLNK
jgi:hypothetical protein